MKRLRKIFYDILGGFVKNIFCVWKFSSFQKQITATHSLERGHSSVEIRFHFWTPGRYNFALGKRGAPAIVGQKTRFSRSVKVGLIFLFSTKFVYQFIGTSEGNPRTKSEFIFNQIGKTSRQREEMTKNLYWEAALKFGLSPGRCHKGVGWRNPEKSSGGNGRANVGVYAIQNKFWFRQNWREMW